MLGLQQDWNEAVIWKFYATLEIHSKSERLVWMTGQDRFEASYQDLAAAVNIYYHRVICGKRLDELPLVLVGDLHVSELFYPDNSEFGPRGGLRRIPWVLHEILRHTLLPLAAIGEGEIRWPTLEVIRAVLNGVEVNLLDLLVTQLLECKRNVHRSLGLQPYVMSLVMHTMKGFYGTLEVQHCAYVPYLRDESFLRRPPSP